MTITSPIITKYSLLAAAANKDYKLVYPTSYPSVEADTMAFRGLYYDKDGKLSSLTVQKGEYATIIEANDDRANEIYEWYCGAVRDQ